MTATVTPPASPPTGVAPLPRSRVLPRDLLAISSVGLRTRRMRTTLTALGIAIGIAALVAVMGISTSSRADLNAKIDALGPNRLVVEPGQSFSNDTVTLPADGVAMIRRIGPVTDAASITSVSGATVRRTDLIDPNETGGISVQAASTSLARTLGATVRTGRFLDAATERVPAVVLGWTAAQRLGITDLTADPAVFIGGHWFTVIGILDPIPLQPNLDTATFIGYPVAGQLFGTSTSPSQIHVVTTDAAVQSVEHVLAATVNPQSPGEVQVSRPSDSLAAKSAANSTLTALLLGLGGVALLVGGIGIANVMVIGVLERRTEIGVRRALGATRSHVRVQFLIESVLLAAIGGIAGVALGVIVTVAYAQVRGSVLSMPLLAVVGGIGAAIVVGAVAGISPAARAARLEPADAIRPA